MWKSLLSSSFLVSPSHLWGQVNLVAIRSPQGLLPASSAGISLSLLGFNQKWYQEATALTRFFTIQLSNVFFTPLSFLPLPSSWSGFLIPSWRRNNLQSLLILWCFLIQGTGEIFTPGSCHPQLSLHSSPSSQRHGFPSPASPSLSPWLVFLSKVQHKSLFLVTSHLGPGSPAANMDSSYSVRTAPSSGSRVWGSVTYWQHQIHKSLILSVTQCICLWNGGNNVTITFRHQVNPYSVFIA